MIKPMNWKYNLKLTILLTITLIGSFLLLIYVSKKDNQFIFIKHDRKPFEEYKLIGYEIKEDTTDIILFRNANMKIKLKPQCSKMIQETNLIKIKNEKIRLKLSQVSVFDTKKYQQEMLLEPLEDYVCDIEKTMKRFKK